ncbi:MAG: efflux RND transporter periplasmic adaptor subunit [Gemmatimonadota bacterium]
MSTLTRWYRAGAPALVLGALVAACGGGSEAQQSSGQDADSAGPDGTAGSARVVNVQVRELTSEPFAEYVTVTAEVQAERDVTVAAEEGGVIRAVLAEKGTRLAAGQPIARIDDRVLRAQFQQAQAEASLAAETWQRQQRLWEQDRIGTELSYLQAKYAAERTAAAARGLQERLDRMTIRAPISGVLEERGVEVGSTVAVGSPVARIVDADPVKVVGGVPERYAAQVVQGAPATVGFDNRPGALEGRTRFVGSAVDVQSRTFLVEVDVPNPGSALKPGMQARLSVQLRSIDEALLVPRDAVLRSADGYVVYVVVEEAGQSVARARAVELGAGSAGQVVVDAGLSAGDRVIVVGQQQVAAGDVVRVVDIAGEESSR